MSVASIAAKTKRVQPQRLRVAIATAYTMWTQCGSCEYSRKCRTHCEPDADSVRCCECIQRTHDMIYGGKV